MAKIPDGLRPDLAAALDEEVTLFGAKKSLKAAADVLRDDEHVLAATTCEMRRGKDRAAGTVLIATDLRVLLIHAAGAASSVEEVPYTSITSVSARRGVTIGQMSITAAGVQIDLHNINKKRAQPVADAIQDRMRQGTTHGLPSAAATQRLDISAEIVKLAGLRSSGVLTEAEFALAKDRLIRGA